MDSRLFLSFLVFFLLNEKGLLAHERCIVLLLISFAQGKVKYCLFTFNLGVDFS